MRIPLLLSFLSLFCYSMNVLFRPVGTRGILKVNRLRGAHRLRVAHIASLGCGAWFDAMPGLYM
jgi:hypothetical protein